jgi:hypothetical protein
MYNVIVQFMKRAKVKTGPMSLSEARASLSSLVNDIETLRKVAITIRGDVRAWLVAPSLAASPTVPRRPMRGSLKLTGDIEGVDTTAELQAAAVRRARRAGLI